MKRLILYLLLTLALILITTSALAGVEALNLPWWTIDGGGGATNGGTYDLSGSSGQPDAGQMQGGSFTIVGGFFGGARAPQPSQVSIFLPLVLR